MRILGIQLTFWWCYEVDIVIKQFITRKKWMNGLKIEREKEKIWVEKTAGLKKKAGMKYVAFFFWWAPINPKFSICRSQYSE